MAEPVFITGFPGFLGTNLILKLSELYSQFEFYCLVQPKYLGQADESRDQMESEAPRVKGKIFLLEGDITEADCGLSEDDLEFISDECIYVWHLAAIYDLGVKKTVAQSINVDGTRNVVQLIQKFKRLKQFFYISTAYVSGKRRGRIYEEELDAGQAFRNFYEESKFKAEVIVKDHMKIIPTTIFRPSIVIGDSKTGRTQKFDGPYFAISMMDRFPKYFIMPVVGSGNHYVNLVPSDFVLDAMAYLAVKVDSIGKVYHLTDSKPLTQLELVQLFASQLKKKLIFIRLPKFLVKILLMIPGIQQLLGLPVHTLDYFDHPHEYDATHTLADLKGSGIYLNPLPSYADKMISFYLDSKRKIRSKAMY